MQNEMKYHTTVLLHEGVDALNLRPGGVYVDATLGAAGHTIEILKRLGEKGKVYGFDQDDEAMENAPNDPRFELCFGNFRFLKRFLAAKGVEQVDGVIADLGVSGHHFDEADRGFSFRFSAELDMRMNRNQAVSAVKILNEYEFDQLVGVFKKYGESTFARAIAKRIIAAREEAVLLTTDQLVALIGKAVPERKLKAELPKIFQAIRIEVNQELEALKEFLVQTQELLKPDGRIVVLSYHSLEDRLVKHFLRAGNFDDQQQKDVFGNIQRLIDPLGKAIVPSDKEVENNPRARSAKMRIGVKRK
ncbi:MAG: 16S rRNA (cytosine(1402)-N(4))-methyltransferase RsmH [Salibacteraceae bacterium]